MDYSFNFQPEKFSLVILLKKGSLSAWTFNFNFHPKKNPLSISLINISTFNFTLEDFTLNFHSKKFSL